MINLLVLFLVIGLIIILCIFSTEKKMASFRYISKKINLFKKFPFNLKVFLSSLNLQKKLVYKIKSKYTSTSSRDVFESIKEIKEYLSILTKNVSKKDEEIDRLKKGYDLKIFKDFLNRFLRVYRIVEEDVEFYTEKSNREISKILNNIKFGLKEAFLDCGLEEFQPQEGEIYKECFGLSENVEHVNTDDKTKDMKIVKVKKKGFKMKTYCGYEVIRPAIVSIYKYTERK